MKLEEEHLIQGKQLSAEQIKFIGKAIPYSKERYVESKPPKYQLCQDILYAGKLKEVRRVCLYMGKFPDHAALICITTRYHP
ncbi:MAG: hypothetical protein ACLSW0_03865 [Akkermansia sp.]|nr:hypothetical protein F2A07_01055 [Akkermansia sp. BIOML-A61]